MNNIISSKRVSSLLGVAALVLLGSSISAHAQTSAEQVEIPVIEIAPTQPAENVKPTTEPAQATTVPIQEWQDNTTAAVSETASPVPGTTATTSAAFVNSQPPAEAEAPAAQTSEPRVAQGDIDPGRATRGGSSYIGVAGNIGINGGDSALGDGNFAIISKVGLTRTFSVRPSVILGDNTAFLIPVTYDFSFQQTDPFAEQLTIAPYAGAGIALSTGDDNQAAFMLSGGVDVPLTRQFTATAGVNAAFFDQTDIGILLGVGYNFSGL